MNIQIDEFRLYKFFYVKQMSWHDCRLSVLNEDSNKLYMLPSPSETDIISFRTDNGELTQCFANISSCRPGIPLYFYFYINQMYCGCGSWTTGEVTGYQPDPT